MSDVNGKVSVITVKTRLTLPSLNPSKSEHLNMAGGFYRALGALIPGRKAKPASGSFAIINCMTLAAKGINLCSEQSCIIQHVLNYSLK